MSTARQARGAAGVSRIQAKLKTSLDAGNFYEAHQLYRTLYFRYSAQSKLSDAEDLLYDGAVELFKKKQISSGTDLSKLYIEVLEKRDDRTEEEREKAFQRLANLFQKIPRESPDFDAFKAKAIQWTSSHENPSGHPRLRQLLAYNLWSCKRYSESRQNFLYSCDGSGCGKMLIDFHKDRGFSSEVDIFIVNTVLQYLVLRKHIVAAWALKSYTENHPEIGKTSPPFKHPLLNFIWLLILAIQQKETITAFSTLVELYKPSLQRDPGYFDAIDKIGQHFFGLPEPQRPRGMFSGLMDSFFSAMNESSDEEGGPSRNTNNNTNAPSISMDSQDLD